MDQHTVGCVLVKDEELHRNTFALTPAYLAHGNGGKGMTGGDLPWFRSFSLLPWPKREKSNSHYKRILAMSSAWKGTP